MLLTMPSLLLFLSIPRADLTHRPLSHRRHNILLHILTTFLQIRVFAVVLGLPPLFPHVPARNNNDCYGDIDRPIDPEGLRDSRLIRILEIEEYISIYNSNEMNLKVYNGFYDEHKTGFKKLLNRLLNMAVRRIGIIFAPYIIFVGTKK